MAKCYAKGSGEEARMVCSGCGESASMPYGVVAWCAGVMRAFEAAHLTCQPGDAPSGRTRLARQCQSSPDTRAALGCEGGAK
jgi:hypothetical protein